MSGVWEVVGGCAVEEVGKVRAIVCEVNAAGNVGVAG